MPSIRRALLGAVLPLIATVGLICVASAADHPLPPADCLVVDTDTNLDDLRALSVIATKRRVAAVIATDGILPADKGASTLARFLSAGGAQGHPVLIQGRGRPSTAPEAPAWPWLEDARKDAWRLEDRLAQSVSGPPLAVLIPSAAHGLAELVRNAVHDCPTLGLVVVGPWSSGSAYFDQVVDRVKFVLVQGRSPEDPDDPGWDRVNCFFDEPSCRNALDRLRFLPFAWIDLPKEGPAYPLDLDLINRFTGTPLAQALRALMRADEQWKTQQLWDDSTAIFLMRPDVFKEVGEHYEPAISPAEMRKIFGDIVSAP